LRLKHRCGAGRCRRTALIARCWLCCCTTAAQAIDLQQDLLLTFNNLIQLILAFLNLTAENQYHSGYRKVVAGVGLKAGCEH
jgi:hypothetical protein